MSETKKDNPVYAEHAPLGLAPIDPNARNWEFEKSLVFLWHGESPILPASFDKLSDMMHQESPLVRTMLVLDKPDVRKYRLEAEQESATFTIIRQGDETTVQLISSATEPDSPDRDAIHNVLSGRIFHAYREYQSKILMETISDLEQRVEAVGDTLSSIGASVLEFPPAVQANMVRDLNEKLARVQNELEAVKAQTIPQLSKVQEFIRNNVDFLVAAIEAKGMMREFQGFRGQIDALEKRVSQVESQVNKAWDRRFSLSSIVVALLSMAVAVYAVFFK